MRHLTLPEVLKLHRRIIESSGGVFELRDMGLLESALAQPQMTFGGDELYPTLAEKAAALCFSLVSNHPFGDGNKRIGHAAMEAFLILNGYELQAPVGDAERTILELAAGNLPREELLEWVKKHLVRSKVE